MRYTLLSSSPRFRYCLKSMSENPSSVKAVINNWGAKLLASPDRAQRIGGIFKFQILGDDGGTWLFHCSENPQVEETDGNADCTVTLSSADLLRIANAELNPQVAYMMGKLKVSGDLSLALKLSEIM